MVACTMQYKKEVWVVSVGGASTGQQRWSCIFLVAAPAPLVGKDPR